MTETISREEIDKVKREFILRNTLLDPVKVSEILGYSVKKVYRLIESGELEETNDTPGRQGVRVTAWSVEQYRIRCTQKAAAYRSGELYTKCG
ncbi:helix-turn-helix domain-containing protein [Desulfuromonas sp. KJ2020]|uniref:helix-turn-helix domain-containing protein n=1 Tax=Desulfuromonas sp. KJ2020 TaxID=2919173 RepID=UPI0020A80D9B|nr:helix-turn-helix domain-containing protein [Desulfuromonas sp. KJ2020]MCP3177293.1 helix-turn-helix domain-containing protein [Desulfuromonas sp. KJ2020]